MMNTWVSTVAVNAKMNVYPTAGFSLRAFFDIIFSYYNLQESYTSKEIIVKMTKKALLAALSLELVLMLFATSTNSPKYSQKREEKV